MRLRLTNSNIFLAVLGTSVAILLLLITREFYLNQKENSTKITDTHCRLLAYVNELNDYYKEHDRYPHENEWAEILEERLPVIDCGRLVKVVGKDILDPWGDSYCYKTISNANIVVYSRNLGSNSLLQVDDDISIPAFNLAKGGKPVITYVAREDSCD